MRKARTTILDGFYENEFKLSRARVQKKQRRQYFHMWQVLSQLLMNRSIWDEFYIKQVNEEI